MGGIRRGLGLIYPSTFAEDVDILNIEPDEATSKGLEDSRDQHIEAAWCRGGKLLSGLARHQLLLPSLQLPLPLHLGLAG